MAATKRTPRTEATTKLHVVVAGRKIDISEGAQISVQTWTGTVARGFADGGLDEKNGRHTLGYGDHWCYLDQIVGGEAAQAGSLEVSQYAARDEEWNEEDW